MLIAQLHQKHPVPYYASVRAGRSDNSNLSHTLLVFKQYLDTNGPLLANEPQFLSYYALPYVPRPQSHPAFAHIFTPTFVPDLRSQLTNVLHSAPAKPSLPRLYSMYAAAQAALQLPSSATLPSDGKTLQPGMGLKQRPPLSPVASIPISRPVHSSSRPSSGAADRELHGTRRPVSGAAGMGWTGNSRPLSGASGTELTGNTLPLSGTAGMGSNGNSQPISGGSQASRRPISALLNSSKELAELVSVSKPRYTDQSAAPSLELSAEVLHGQYVSCTAHVPPASKYAPMLQQGCISVSGCLLGKDFSMMLNVSPTPYVYTSMCLVESFSSR